MPIFYGDGNCDQNCGCADIDCRELREFHPVLIYSHYDHHDYHPLNPNYNNDEQPQCSKLLDLPAIVVR